MTVSGKCCVIGVFFSSSPPDDRQQLSSLVNEEQWDDADYADGSGTLTTNAYVWSVETGNNKSGLTSLRHRVLGLQVGRDVSVRRGFGLNSPLDADHCTCGTGHRSWVTRSRCYNGKLKMADER